jgi:6-phospho-beta-glucosidase
VDAQRLETVAGFTARMARAKGAAVKIETTRELPRALSGADFVIAQIRVGGNAARREDERLGMRHGLIGQETTGVGGFAKALRTIPAMLEICRAMEQSCPRAFLVNFTNPSGLVTEALLKHARTRVIGLCNIPITFHLEMAKALGAERNEVDFDYIGLNHLSWVRRVTLRGEDVTARVLEWAGDAGRPANLEELDYPEAVIRALGAIPMHYLRYYYLTSKMLEEQRGKTRTRADEVMEIETELMKIYGDPKLSAKPEMLSKRGGAHYSLAALELIESIHFDRGDTAVLDVTNGSAVAGLPAESVVEVRCRVGAEGAVPLPLDPPGPAILGLMRAVKAYEELTVKAAVERDYESALLALLAHPLGPAADRVEQVLKDLMDTHKIGFDHHP